MEYGVVSHGDVYKMILIILDDRKTVLIPVEDPGNMLIDSDGVRKYIVTYIE